MKQALSRSLLVYLLLNCDQICSKKWKIVMYVEANEGKLRRNKGILDEKVMAFDTQDFIPSSYIVH
jgi:hypothetical protein